MLFLLTLFVFLSGTFFGFFVSLLPTKSVLGTYKKYVKPLLTFGPPRAVVFSDGTYGIKKGLGPLAVFYDFRAKGEYWWSQKNGFFLRGDCKTDATTCEKVLADMTDSGLPVDFPK